MHAVNYKLSHGSRTMTKTMKRCGLEIISHWRKFQRGSNTMDRIPAASQREQSNSQRDHDRRGVKKYLTVPRLMPMDSRQNMRIALFTDSENDKNPSKPTRKESTVRSLTTSHSDGLLQLSVKAGTSVVPTADKNAIRFSTPAPPAPSKFRAAPS